MPKTGASDAALAQTGLREEEIDLDLVFQATLNFLYRLMFVAYAESLDLLPVNETHGYRQRSLHALKPEVAAKAATWTTRPTPW